jgi:hypothetical protein
MIACIVASFHRKATVTLQIRSRHCHACSQFPRAGLGFERNAKGGWALSSAAKERPHADKSKPMLTTILIILLIIIILGGGGGYYGYRGYGGPGLGGALGLVIVVLVVLWLLGLLSGGVVHTPA